MISKTKPTGFTLIELLIVVAIIGILAAIAVPNFMHAQVRAKVANIQGELRTLKTAMESYQVDRGAYPVDAFVVGKAFWAFNPFVVLTTPIAYLSAVPVDDFYVASTAVDYSGLGKTQITEVHTYFYASDGWMSAAVKANNVLKSDFMGKWIAFSVGPDQVYSYGEWIFYRPEYSKGNPRSFDPSNGAISSGDIGAWGP